MNRTIGCFCLLFGICAGCFALIGLRWDIAWVAHPFYAYAWWAYILVLDGACALRRGHSLFTSRFRYVLPICLWSITVWFLFELLNVRFQNWYYVGVYAAETWAQWTAFALFTFICFATVFMGIFQTYEALTAFGLWRKWRGRPTHFPGWISYAVQGVGAAMAALAILFPYYLAPLIWGSVTLLIDPWNYRRGARSILRDIETREWGIVARYFVAGLICGLLWEAFNFFAPQKWIYTVRGFENFKLFEMPLLGFLGFPGLVFDCVTLFSFFAYWFLGNETWEHPQDLPYELKPRPRVSRMFFWEAAAIQLCISLLVFMKITDASVGSLQVELSNYLSQEEVQRLKNAKIDRPRQLIRALAEPKRSSQIQRELEWDERRTAEVFDNTRLFTFKGIGVRHGVLLRDVGVNRPESLRHCQPSRLHTWLLAASERRGLPAPRLDMVRVWVLASRDRGIVMRTNQTED